MANQIIFKQDFIDKLKNDVISGKSVDLYFGDKFPVSEENTSFYCKFIQAPNELNLIGDIEHDFENAVKLYNAYPNLLPIQASSEILWTTLSHTILFDYVKQRWQYKRGNKRNFILNYWFVSKDSALMRNALAGLWWAVYLTIDDKADEEHKYDLTKILFKNQTLKGRVFGTSILIRHKEAARGILRFINDNEQLFEDSFERKARFIMRYFNQLGASKQLTTLDESFFYNKMSELYGGIILAANDESLDDVQDNDDETLVAFSNDADSIAEEYDDDTE